MANIVSVVCDVRGCDERKEVGYTGKPWGTVIIKNNNVDMCGYHFATLISLINGELVADPNKRK
jgi:hypothetical protein